MGLNIDTTFRFVQFVANKQHRGWITPEEFNLAAEIAQLSLYSEKEAIFMQTKKIGYDMLPFSTRDVVVPVSGEIAYPSDFRHLIRIYDLNTFKRYEELDQSEIADAMNSSIVAPSPSYPAIVQRDSSIGVYPVTLTADVVIEYLRKPTTPNWDYTVANSRPVYSVGLSVNFDFDEVLFMEVSSRILEHVGINLKDMELAQYMKLHQQKEAN